MEDSKIGVVFFGDSVSVGDGVPVHETWVHKVSEKLCADFPGKVMTRNSSVSGETTRQALMRMGYHIGRANDPKPKILVTQFGLNDSNCWKNEYDGCRVSRAAYAANMQEIIDRAQSKDYGFDQVVLLTAHIPTKNYPHLAREVCARNDILKDIQFKGDQISLINMPRGSVSADIAAPFLLSDGVHLNSEGHAYYFSKVYCILCNLIELIKERGIR